MHCYLVSTLNTHHYKNPTKTGGELSWCRATWTPLKTGGELSWCRATWTPLKTGGELSWCRATWTPQKTGGEGSPPVFCGVQVARQQLSSPPVFSGVQVARSLVFFAVFCGSLHCLFLCSFSFDHCMFCVNISISWKTCILWNCHISRQLGTILLKRKRLIVCSNSYTSLTVH
jgi:hypothetical protein